jgi:hypothetical protein
MSELREDKLAEIKKDFFDAKFNYHTVRWLIAEVERLRAERARIRAALLARVDEYTPGHLAEADVRRMIAEVCGAPPQGKGGPNVQH